MTNKEIIQNYNNLSILRGHDISFPARVSFIITQNIRKLQPIFEDYENAKMIIARKYGYPAPGQPGTYNIPEERIEDAQKEIDELNDVDHDIKFLKIKLENIESLQLSIQDMEALYPMLEED